MKIKQKLILGFLGVAFLILVVAALSIISLRNIRVVFTEIKEDIVPGVIAIFQLSNAVNDIQHKTMEYINRGQRRDELQQATQTLRQYGQEHLEHEKHIGDKEKEAPQELNLKIERINSIAAEIVNMKDSGAAFEQLLEKDKKELHPAMHELDEILDKHKLIHSEELRRAEEEASQIQTRVTIIILIAGILIFCLAIASGHLISISISHPIMRLKDAAAEIGKGKLGFQVKVNTKDELADLASSFNKMSADLQNNQEEIQVQNEELNTSNEELKSSNEEIATTNEELRVATEELKQTNEELVKLKTELEKKVEERTRETTEAKQALEKKVVDLERFNKLSVGRELAMKELKGRIAELEAKLKENRG